MISGILSAVSHATSRYTARAASGSARSGRPVRSGTTASASCAAAPREPSACAISCRAVETCDMATRGGAGGWRAPLPCFLPRSRPPRRAQPQLAQRGPGRGATYARSSTQ
eukprot:scaffold1839_cov382-Prasinococcus_capsulatus_cf.AAC.20